MLRRAKDPDIPERVAVDYDEIGAVTDRNAADIVLPLEKGRVRAGRGADDRSRRKHLCPEGEFEPLIFLAIAVEVGAEANRSAL
ncbi:hypothetical protein NKJ08_20050 [Mesorhizobium sp. M0244]